jgi:uncharacterized protein YjiS (DUF1127 family)
MENQSQSSGRDRLGSVGVAFAELASQIVLTMKVWRERRRLLKELVALERQDGLDRVLTDIGIARSDLPRLLRAHPRTPEQLADMMRRLGIARAALARDPAKLEALRAMEWRCAECTNWRQCRAWLDAPVASITYRAFCPNAEALDDLRAHAASDLAQGRRGVLGELDQAARE